MIKCKRNNVKIKGDIEQVETEIVCAVFKFMFLEFENGDKEQLEKVRKMLAMIINSENKKELSKNMMNECLDKIYKESE